LSQNRSKGLILDIRIWGGRKKGGQRNKERKEERREKKFIL
jgi:hypothetical protein